MGMTFDIITANAITSCMTFTPWISALIGTIWVFNPTMIRLRALVNQTNHGGVEYPNGTNERGYPGRERHAAGDRVGSDDVESHAHGDRVGRKCGGEASAPGRGGSRMSSHFGEPQKGRET